MLAGFAGAAADAFTLFELFEAKLEKHGQLQRAAVELAKDWRTERRYGKLEALLAVADRETSLIISGTGDVIEPEDGIIAIGSGGSYALSAARALLAHTPMDAKVDRGGSTEHRRRHLHLHQPQCRGRRTLRTRAIPLAPPPRDSPGIAGASVNVHAPPLRGRP